MDGRIALPAGTLLDGSYRIERVIGSGGFGITYVADDLNLETTVAIKEYFPEQFGRRDASLSVRPTSKSHDATFEWGRTSFVREARTLARFRHPSIVQVTRVFEANATAYMVMAFEQGRSFETWLKGLGRAPTQEELDRIASPLLDALEMMHAQTFLHRDIAPDNIIVRADGTPVLLDFGAARRAIAEQSRVLTGIVKSGYSPQEQYATDGRLQGPWTDLYAFGATFYRAMTGKPPEEATLRAMDDKLVPAADGAVGTYRAEFLAAIDACLQVRPSDRPQSVARLRPMLLAPLPNAIARRVGTRKVVEPKPEQARSGRGAKFWWAAAAAVAITAGIYGGFQYARSHEQERAGVQLEARRKADQDAKQREDAAAAVKKADQEAQARVRAEADAKRKREEEARQEDERRQKAAVEEARRQQQEARRKAEDEERQKAEQDAKRQADVAAAIRARQEATKVAVLPVPATPADQPDAGSDVGALVRAIQTELKRVGCDPGAIDGNWGPRGMEALRKFAGLAKIALTSDQPSEAALGALAKEKGRVCPLNCRATEIEKKGECVSAPVPSYKGPISGPKAEKNPPAQASCPSCCQQANGCGSWQAWCGKCKYPY